MIDQATISSQEELSGLLFDEYPVVTISRVRPFVASLLLLRGAVRCCEVAACLSSHVQREDILVGGCPETFFDHENITRLESIVNQTLAEYVADGLIRFRDDGLYVVTPKGLQKLVAWTCALNAQLPDHLLNEI